MGKHSRRGRPRAEVRHDVERPGPDPAAPEAAASATPAAPAAASLVEVGLYGLLGAVVAAVVMAVAGFPWWQAALVPALAVLVAGLLLLYWSVSTRPSSYDDGAEPVRGRRARRRHD